MKSIGAPILHKTAKRNIVGHPAKLSNIVCINQSRFYNFFYVGKFKKVEHNFKIF